MVLNMVLNVVLNLMLNSISFHFNDFLVRVSVTEYRCDTFLENLVYPCKGITWSRIHGVE